MTPIIPAPKAVLASVVMIAALGASAAAADDEQLTVVTTTGMIADTAARIGGDLVDVRGLMGAGIDPHAYRQTRSDIAALTQADVVLWHGLNLEAQMRPFMEQLAERSVVVAVGEAVPEDGLIADPEYDGQPDPHVWMDPELWGHVVDAIEGVLVAEDPDNASVYEANAEAFRAELSELAAYSEETLQSVPENSRVLVTAHDAFAYFGRAYDFEVLGIQGISTQSEAGLQRIAELVDTLVDRDITAVFVESSVSDRNVRALIEGAAAEGHTVKIGGELFSDAMGPEGTYEGTFLGMLDHNVTGISSALGGDAPSRGRLGKLGGEG